MHTPNNITIKLLKPTIIIILHEWVYSANWTTAYKDFHFMWFPGPAWVDYAQKYYLLCFWALFIIIKVTNCAQHVSLLSSKLWLSVHSSIVLYFLWGFQVSHWRDHWHPCKPETELWQLSILNCQVTTQALYDFTLSFSRSPPISGRISPIMLAWCSLIPASNCAQNHANIIYSHRPKVAYTSNQKCYNQNMWHVYNFSFLTSCVKSL